MCADKWLNLPVVPQLGRGLRMKQLAILGSTGSIGQQTVDVVLSHRDLFAVCVLAANTNDELLEKQIDLLSPDLAVLSDDKAAARLKARYKGKTHIEGGKRAFIEAAAHPTADIVVTSMTGFAGLEPTMKALEKKKDVALANKETLVVAGALIMSKAREMGAAILPVDSEHSAIFQCLQGEEKRCVERIILTASGGPFRAKTVDALKKATVKECLTHPTWQMGKKITIDSATLINKGLEVIEAHWLYDVAYDAIEVIVHKESIIHSMVGFTDGAIIAQIGPTDMRLPIQYALTYPLRQPSNFKRLDFADLSNLSFEKPDMKTFRGLSLAYEAGRSGGTLPCVFNAANEIAVAAFLKGKIHFLDIYTIIEKTMEKSYSSKHIPTLDDLFAADSDARRVAQDFLQKIGG